MRKAVFLLIASIIVSTLGTSVVFAYSGRGIRINTLHALAEARVHYEEALERLRETRKELRESKKEVREGKQTIREGKREKGSIELGKRREERQAQRLEQRKEVIRHIFQMIRAKLDRIEKQLTRRRPVVGDAERSLALQRIAALRDYLDEKAQALDDATTIEDVKAIAREIRIKWRLERLNIRRIITTHFAARLERLADLVSSRIERIGTFSAGLADEEFSDRINGLLEDARGLVEEARGSIAEGREKLSDEITDESRKELREAVADFREAHARLREALHKLREAASRIREAMISPEPIEISSPSPLPTPTPTPESIPAPSI